METGINVLKVTASHLAIEDESVDLIVTSPPYPMVEMWDTIFSDQEKQIPKYLSEGQGRKAFELMQTVTQIISQTLQEYLEGGIGKL